MNLTLGLNFGKYSRHYIIAPESNNLPPSHSLALPPSHDGSWSCIRGSGSQTSQRHIINLSPCMFNIQPLRIRWDTLTSHQYPPRRYSLICIKASITRCILTLTLTRKLFTLSKTKIFDTKYAKVSRFVNHLKCAPLKSLSKRNAEKVKVEHYKVDLPPFTSFDSRFSGERTQMTIPLDLVAFDNSS